MIEAKTNALSYLCWAIDPLFVEESPCSKIVARFSYLQDALDYARSCTAAIVVTGEGKQPSGYGAVSCSDGIPVDFTWRPFLEFVFLDGTGKLSERPAEDGS